MLSYRHWNGIKEDKVILQARTNNRTNSSDTVPNATLGHPGCLIPRTQDFVPWDNPDSTISFHTEDIVCRVKDVVFLPLLFLIGRPASSVINMAVF